MHMLDDHDRRVVERDPRLPGLGWVLDEARLAELLNAAAPGLHLRAAEPTYLRYKPGTSAVAGFRLHWAHQTPPGAPLDVQVSAYPAARHAEVSARLQTPAAGARGTTAPGTKVPGMNGSGTHASTTCASTPNALPPGMPRSFDALGLSLQTPADDRSLRRLRRLLDDTRRPRLLRRLLGDVLGEGPVGLECLRYKPGRRFVARLEQGGRPLAVLRVCHADGYPSALLGAALGAATVGPRLLGTLDHRHLLATAWAPGKSACPEQGGALEPLAIQALGRTLGRLHLSRLHHPMQRTAHCEAAACARAARALAVLCPDLAAWAMRLVAQAESLLRAATGPAVLVHGDFSADQAVHADGRWMLVDWDRAASGPAAADLGSFAARLEMQVIDGTVPRLACDAAVAALRHGHAGTRHLRAPDEPALDLHTACALLRLAAEGFRRRLAHWPAREAALLARAEALLARAGRRLSLPDPSAHGLGTTALPAAEATSPRECTTVPDDPAMPGLQAALDPVAMHGHLARCLGLAAGALQVRAANLLRHKPGRRCLVQYDIDVAGHVDSGIDRARGIGSKAESDTDTRTHTDTDTDTHTKANANANANANTDTDTDIPSPAHGSPTRTLQLLAKLRAKGLDQTACDVQRRLRQAGLDGRAGVSVAEPLGTVPELRLWVQRKLPGSSATAAFLPGADVTPAWRVGRALALLHATPVEINRTWTPADELDVLRRRLPAAAALHPALAPRIGRAMRAAECLAAQLSDSTGNVSNASPASMPSKASNASNVSTTSDASRTLTGIHRDFHPDQVLLEGDHVVLLDLDLYCVGDPALDVGNFIAHLIELALRQHGDANALASHQHALVQGYLAHAPGVTTASIDAWTTLGLIRHVQLSTQYAQRRHTTAMVLQTCEARLAALGHEQPVEVTP
jgi:thiamine kinase-like enzyme